MATEQLKCPNCGVAGHAKADGSVVCPQCGGTFTFKAGEAKLADVGEFDRTKAKVAEHDADLKAIKEQLGIGAAEPPAADEAASEPAGQSGEDEDDTGDEDEV